MLRRNKRTHYQATRNHYQATRIHSEPRRDDKPGRARWEYILLAVLVVFCGISAYFLLSSKHFVIKQVRLHQEGKQIPIASLTRIISSHTKGSFFSMNCDRLRRRLLLLPWVESVSVRRRWPDALLVDLRERHAAAVWNESALLDDEGVVFYPPLESFPAGLPLLSSDQQEPTRVLTVYHYLSGALSRFALRVSSLKDESASAWRATLTTGTQVVLPKKKTKEAVQRWLSVYPQLMAGKMDAVERIDLRYAHGLAVQWALGSKPKSIRLKRSQKKIIN